MGLIIRLEIGNKAINNPTWGRIRSELSSLQHLGSNCIGLFGEKEELMIICYAFSYGFYITARQEDELGEKVALGSILHNEIVDVMIDSYSEKLPISVFIDEIDATKIVKYFFETGKRSPEYCWKNPFEFEEEYNL